MDFVPIISSFILYFFIALVAVVVTSYILFKVMKSKNDAVQQKVHERRKHIKRYIIEQTKYYAKSSESNSKHLSYRNYSAPTYSDKKFSSRQREVTYTKPTFTPSQEATQQRYTIVNYTRNNAVTRPNSNATGKPYSPFLNPHYYKD